MMKMNLRLRVLSLLLIALMVVPLVPASAAQVASSSGAVQLYWDSEFLYPNTTTKLNNASITAGNGWYKVEQSSVVGGYIKPELVTSGAVTITTVADPEPQTPSTPSTPSTDPTTGGTTAPNDGEVDDTFSEEILTYTVRDGGLWLYASVNGAGAIPLAKGVKLNLTVARDAANAAIPGWYTTSYNRQIYYVNGSELYDTSSTFEGRNISVIIKDASELYPDELLTPGTQVNIGLVSGNRYNVTTYLRKADKGRLYVYTQGGVKYYMRGANIESEMAATVASNDSVNTIIQLNVTGTDANGNELPLFTDTNRTDRIRVPVGTVLYGTRHGTEWYKVTYNGKTYYVLQSEVGGRIGNPTQHTVTAGTASGTLSVTIGSTDAALSTYSGGVFTPTSETLPAGSRHTVSVFTSEYYSVVTGSGTRYFLKTAAAGATSSTTNSFKITLGADETAYTATDKKTAKTIKAGTYTATSHDNNWYKITYEGGTVYLEKSYATNDGVIGGTTVGKTYSVTIGDSVAIGGSSAPLYRAVGSTDTVGTLQPGVTIRAKKHNDSWFIIDLNGTNGYLNLRYIAAIDGDATGGGGTGTGGGTVAVGQTIRYPLSNVDGYTSKSKTASHTKMSGTYALTRIDSEWFSFDASGVTIYILASDLDLSGYGGTSTGGGTVAVGQTIRYPLSNVDGYTSKSKTASHTKMSGTYALTRIDSEWFSFDASGVTIYILASDLDLSSYGGGTGTGGGIAIGGTITTNITQGTGYFQMSTTGSSTPMRGTYTLTRVDATWFRYSDANTTLYVLASDIGQSGVGTGTGGSTVAIGGTITADLTLVTGYFQMSTSASSTSMTGTYTLTRVDATWFRYSDSSVTLYVLASDIGQSGAGTGTGGIAFDGTGYRTAYLTIRTTTGDLNLRATAGQNGAILAKIPSGTQVRNLDYQVVNGIVWYKVSYGGKDGYVHGAYINPVADVGGTTPGAVFDPSQNIGRALSVSVSTVNVRSGPSGQYSIIGSVAKGATIVPIAHYTDTDGILWYQFQYNNSTKAYIMSEFLTGGVESATVLDGTVVVKANETNLRNGPGTNFGYSIRLKKGDIVTIVGDGTDQGGTLWYRVRYEGQFGYLRYDLVRALTLAESSALIGSIPATYPLLSIGSKNSQVLTLQTTLNNKGFDVGKADGVYGVKTAAGVRAFQMANGISATGMADSATQAKLYGAGTVGGLTPITYAVLTIGSKNDDVIRLQTALNAKGYNVGKVDGVYGVKTAAGVRSFQTNNALGVTGIADNATQAKLYGTGATGATGTTTTLDWFSAGVNTIAPFTQSKGRSFSVFDIKTGVTWYAYYVNGTKHADVIPASRTEANKLTAYNITGNYARRPVIVTLNGVKYAGSMYAVGHGSTSYCSYFAGVMCIHFTGSTNHTSDSAESFAQHQAAILEALNSGY